MGYINVCLRIQAHITQFFLVIKTRLVFPLAWIISFCKCRLAPSVKLRVAENWLEHWKVKGYINFHVGNITIKGATIILYTKTCTVVPVSWCIYLCAPLRRALEHGPIFQRTRRPDFDYTYIHIYVCVCIYVYVYIYIYINNWKFPKLIKSFAYVHWCNQFLLSN